MKPLYGRSIRQLYWASDQAMTATLASMDLTAAQGHIMGYISHQQTPPCAKDIEEFFQLSHPTVSGLLSRLEKKGFIAFCPDPDDRRCKRIYLLPKGLQLKETMHQTILTTEAQLVQGFTQEEQLQFRDLLTRAIENLGGQPCTHIQKEEPIT